MGKLHYAGLAVLDVDDRALAHLEAVMTAKLRRGEAFVLSWRDDQRVGDGRTSVWVHPTMPLVFKYWGGRPAELNRAWVEELMQSANSAGGLRILPEPGAGTAPGPASSIGSASGGAAGVRGFVR